MEKEIYIVKFESMQRAQYWRIEFVNKFASDVVSINQSQSRVELTDSVWYFVSKNSHFNIYGMNRQITTELTEEDLYIILDDIERKALDTYEGDDKWERSCPNDYTD